MVLQFTISRLGGSAGSSSKRHKRPVKSRADKSDRSGDCPSSSLTSRLECCRRHDDAMSGGGKASRSEAAREEGASFWPRWLAEPATTPGDASSSAMETLAAREATRSAQARAEHSRQRRPKSRCETSQMVAAVTVQLSKRKTALTAVEARHRGGPHAPPLVDGDGHEVTRCSGDNG